MKQIFPFVATGMLAIAAPVAASDITVIDLPDMNWATTPEGVAFAALEGNRFEEAYQAMVKLPAGIVSPPHVKSANMYGVMLQGEMIHYANDTDPNAAAPIGVGGFYRIPAGLAHVSACVSDVPCIAYLYQDAAFDFLPVSQ